MPRCVLAALVISTWPLAAMADGVGVYGRFDRELVVSAGLGGGARERLDGGLAGLVTVDLRMRWLHTAGIAATWELEPVGSPRQHGTIAVDLRPFFLIFVFQNRFSGRSFADLVVYNLGLEAGIAWDGSRPAFLIGLGTEMPLLRRRAQGLFLRVGSRVHFERERWVGGHGKDTGFEAVLALQWQWGLEA
ncbi:MAG: hypothetical protein HYY06_13490 [Deltaproteobacteria bacterium]|nr:hypothetical protein [Deltaproteobacteria bacterium]